ncbi:MAG TPA: hypothetical protein VK453_01755 [Micromonosporaceae bacterium]|nr:hypothetical protein [Micromonosporaceae bacterium]
MSGLAVAGAGLTGLGARSASAGVSQEPAALLRRSPGYPPLPTGPLPLDVRYDPARLNRGVSARLTLGVNPAGDERRRPATGLHLPARLARRAATRLHAYQHTNAERQHTHRLNAPSMQDAGRDRSGPATPCGQPRRRATAVGRPWWLARPVPGPGRRRPA